MSGEFRSTGAAGATHALPGRKLRVLYMQPNVNSFAGIERVVDDLCTQLAQTYQDTFEIDVFYPSRYHNRVVGDRLYGKIEIETSGRLGFMRVVRQVVAAKDYDVVVVPQVEPTVICWIACLGLGRTFVAHLHGNPRLERSHWKANVLFFLMDKWVLARLPALFGTSPKQLAAFKTMFRSDIPTFWVPNPVRRFEIGDKRHTTDATVTFVNVARFSYQKGQDILIREFAKLYRRRPQARLKVVGYGDEEADIRDLIAREGLTDVVSIEHHPDDPQAALLPSDVYVSSSRWEGWSLAICEALRFGLPVVSTDCEFGPSDILIDERLGRLVPFEDGALAAAMEYYCDNLAAEALHADYRKEYVDRFSVDKVVHIHADALKRVATKNVVGAGSSRDHT
jgi:glycosyltransferase involved in cell wall biosynthesis